MEKENKQVFGGFGIDIFFWIIIFFFIFGFGGGFPFFGLGSEEKK